MDVTPQLAPSPLRGARGLSNSSIVLPSSYSAFSRLTLRDPLEIPVSADNTERSRIFYAAPHVVGSPLSGGSGAVDQIDWEATLRFRDHLWDQGLGVAEAMDTAQRGMGLTWPLAQQLIEMTADRARQRGARLVCGAATDQLDASDALTFNDIIDAYVEQCDFIHRQGAVPVMMASRALASLATTPEQYRMVYTSVIEQSAGPIILHWLGDMFDPELAGYWGAYDLHEVVESLVTLITAHADKIDGIKVSVLSVEHEVALRDGLPAGVRLYTGDDFNYPELIKGDRNGHSDALLGAFNPLATIAAGALDALDANDDDLYDELMSPTIPLAKHLFAAPTQRYKCGIVFLAYLNGHQNHFKMLNGDETKRSVLHYAEVFRLADAAGILRDPGMAVDRMKSYLTLAGVRGE